MNFSGNYALRRPKGGATRKVMDNTFDNDSFTQSGISATKLLDILISYVEREILFLIEHVLASSLLFRPFALRILLGFHIQLSFEQEQRDRQSIMIENFNFNFNLNFNFNFILVRV